MEVHLLRVRDKQLDKLQQFCARRTNDDEVASLVDVVPLAEVLVLVLEEGLRVGEAQWEELEVVFLAAVVPWAAVVEEDLAALLHSTEIQVLELLANMGPDERGRHYKWHHYLVVAKLMNYCYIVE
jgi:hypothetical protein